MLKVDAGDLIMAEWGDSDCVAVGRACRAIGNPFGLIAA